jgi:hypothetical protein
MNALRSLDKRMNAVLFLVILVLLLVLGLTWDRHSTRRMLVIDRHSYASELLAHGLPHEALAALQTEVESEPYSERALKLRRVMAEIMMDNLGDYEKALGELVFIRTFDPKQASGVEDLVKQCLHRLGRVYDGQRRLLLEDGKHPLRPEVSSATVVRLGSEEGYSVVQVQERLAQLGLPLKNPPREQFDQVLQNMTGELLLRREARRSGVNRRPDFLQQVRQFEGNLALQKFLEESILKDVTVDEQALDLYLNQHQQEFSSPLRVVYSELAFPDEAGAREYLGGGTPATAPEILADHSSGAVEELPPALRRIPWETEPVKGVLGPLEIGGKWLVYPIHEVIPAKKVSPDLARQQARLRLLEQKQGGRIAQAITDLARKEEVQMLAETINAAFYPDASGTAGLPATSPAPVK